MIIFIVVGAIFLLALFGAGFVSASPREIKVISGWRKQRVLHGRTGWKVPILERETKQLTFLLTNMLRCDKIYL